MSSDSSLAKTCIGTPYYMSPEMYSSEPYNFKSDVWALGCVLYELCTGKHAFDARNINELSKKVKREKAPPLPPTFSRELNDLCESMLAKNKDDRPPMAIVLTRPIIQSAVAAFFTDMIGSVKKKKRTSLTPLEGIPSGTIMFQAVAKDIITGVDINEAIKTDKAVAALHLQIQALKLAPVVRQAISIKNGMNKIEVGEGEGEGEGAKGGKRLSKISRLYDEGIRSLSILQERKAAAEEQLNDLREKKR
jgi:serine/threonine protein kinase